MAAQTLFVAWLSTVLFDSVHFKVKNNIWNGCSINSRTILVIRRGMFSLVFLCDPT